MSFQAVRLEDLKECGPKPVVRDSACGTNICVHQLNVVDASKFLCQGHSKSTYVFPRSCRFRIRKICAETVRDPSLPLINRWLRIKTLSFTCSYRYWVTCILYLHGLKALHRKGGKQLVAQDCCLINAKISNGNVCNGGWFKYTFKICFRITLWGVNRCNKIWHATSGGNVL